MNMMTAGAAVMVAAGSAWAQPEWRAGPDVPVRRVHVNAATGEIRMEPFSPRYEVAWGSPVQHDAPYVPTASGSGGLAREGATLFDVGIADDTWLVQSVEFAYYAQGGGENETATLTFGIGQPFDQCTEMGLAQGWQVVVPGCPVDDTFLWIMSIDFTLRPEQPLISNSFGYTFAWALEPRSRIDGLGVYTMGRDEEHARGSTGVIEALGGVNPGCFDFGTAPGSPYAQLGILIRGERQIDCNCGDWNCDGFLDFFDYDDYVTCFETNVCQPGRIADFNGDDFVDFFDYDDFVHAFETGC